MPVIQSRWHVMIHAFLVSVIITVVLYEIQLRCSKLKEINTFLFGKDKHETFFKLVEKEHVVEAFLIEEKIDVNIESENNVIATYVYSWDGYYYGKDMASSKFGAPTRIYLLFDEDPRCALTLDYFFESEFDIVRMFVSIFSFTFMFEVVSLL